MRHVLAGVVVLGMLASAAPASAMGFDLGIAAGLQFGGSIGSIDLDTDNGYTLGLELVFEVPVVELGVGYEYGFPLDSDGDVENIDYHLLYGVGRVHILGPAYIMARLGYASASAEIPDFGSGSSGGMSWSAGIGAEVWKLRVEVMYNDFDIDLDDIDTKLDQSYFTGRVILTF
jgi:hypothetical protein